MMIVVVWDWRTAADTGLAVCSPECHARRSVAGRAILIPAARRAWMLVSACGTEASVVYGAQDAADSVIQTSFVPRSVAAQVAKRGHLRVAMPAAATSGNSNLAQFQVRACIA